MTREIMDFLIEHCDFHSYVELPEGKWKINKHDWSYIRAKTSPLDYASLLITIVYYESGFLLLFITVNHY